MAAEADTDTTTIQMNEPTQAFYKGVASASKVREAMGGPEWEKVDYEITLRAFWFHVGVAAGSEHGYSIERGGDQDMLALFMQGAATQVPTEPCYTIINDHPLYDGQYWAEDERWTTDRDEALEVRHSDRHTHQLPPRGAWKLITKEG